MLNLEHTEMCSRLQQQIETASSVLCLFHENLLKQSYNLSRYIPWNSISTGA